MGFLGFGGDRGAAVVHGPPGHRRAGSSIGTLTGFLLYGITIGASLATIAGLYGQFREGTGAVARVFEIIDTPADDRATRRTRSTSSRVTGADRARQRLVRATATGHRVVRDVDARRCRPARCSRSSGRPARARRRSSSLIPRLWDVTGGTIRVDGDGRARRDHGEPPGAGSASCPRRRSCSAGRSRENIRYGRLDATDDEIEAAARAANAHDFISALAAGLRDAGRRPRLAAVGRPAAADRHRPRDPQGPADPAPRRGDERPRQRVRAAGPGGARAAQGGPDDDDRRPPPLDDPRRQPDRGAGRRLARGARARTTSCWRATGCTRSCTGCSSSRTRRTRPATGRARSPRAERRRRMRGTRPAPSRLGIALVLVGRGRLSPVPVPERDDRLDGAAARRCRRRRLPVPARRPAPYRRRPRVTSCTATCRTGRWTTRASRTTSRDHAAHDPRAVQRHPHAARARSTRTPRATRRSQATWAGG